MRLSEDVYTFLSASYRTATYKCSGTVFSPKVEREIRRPPPPAARAYMTFQPSPTEETSLLDEKQNLNGPTDVQLTTWQTLKACLCCANP